MPNLKFQQPGPILRNPTSARFHGNALLRCRRVQPAGIDADRLRTQHLRNNVQCALPAATPRLPNLRRVCHSSSAGLPTYCLIKLQFRDWLCIRTRTGTGTGH